MAVLHYVIAQPYPVISLEPTELTQVRIPQTASTPFYHKSTVTDLPGTEQWGLQWEEEIVRNRQCALTSLECGWV